MKWMIPVLRNLHSPKKRSLPCTGQRNAILSFGRGLVSDECSNTYETSYSDKCDKQGGVHFASRAKMSTFVSCEPDRSVTASRALQLPHGQVTMAQLKP